MSPDLIAFLKAWYDWATSGAPHRAPFSRIDGLCDNTEEFYAFSVNQVNQVYEELKAIFKVLYPFSDEDEYQLRAETATQHECPKRLAWVRERLVEAGEIVETLK